MCTGTYVVELTGSCGQQARPAAAPPALELRSRHRRWRTRTGGCCLCSGLGLLATGCQLAAAAAMQ
jgi:hypothetical protein